MDRQTPTLITLASELAAQGLSQTKIAAHLGRHRETIGLWLKGIATDGLAGFLVRHTQAKKGPRRARQVPATIKRLIWELRVREYECCGLKIAYFLDREHPIRLSVPKVYKVLTEKYEIRSTWHTNQKRGAVPTAAAPRAIMHMDAGAFGGVFAFTGVDIYTKEAEVMLRPALTRADGAAFLQTAMAHRFTGRVAVLQTDGARSARAPLRSRPASIVSGIALSGRTRRTSRRILNASTERCARNAEAGGPIASRICPD
jgi:transposase